MTESSLQVFPANRARRLDNRACLYCGGEPATGNPHTNEHVVGRRFVPKGSLHQSWNLIGNACPACNGRKANLEDDISAITIQPGLGEGHSDSTLQTEAIRKGARSISRRTRKPIDRSHEELTVKGTVTTNLQFSANLIAPPQLDESRVHELAQMHLQAFFYLMTYDEQARVGGFLPGTVGFVARANRPDWGNQVLRGFADLIQSWPLQLDCVLANGFFKVRMRVETENSDVWAFALEWNMAHRIVGFFGNLERAQSHVNNLPDLEWKLWDANTRYRQQISIAPEDDLLFSLGTST